MDDLLKFINTYIQLDDNTEQLVRDSFKIEEYPKGHLLVEEGKVSRKIWFLESGLVRKFCIEDGCDITKWIYYDKQWIASMTSYFSQKPSFEFFEVCEDSTFLSLSYDDEQKLLKDPQFAEFHIKMLRDFLSTLNEWYHLFHKMNSYEKYDFILKNSPGIIQKAKQKHIASMIGVSPETLSRIRAEIS